jgi:hypothetical protein
MKDNNDDDGIYRGKGWDTFWVILALALLSILLFD